MLVWRQLVTKILNQLPVHPFVIGAVASIGTVGAVSRDAPGDGGKYEFGGGILWQYGTLPKLPDGHCGVGAGCVLLQNGIWPKLPGGHCEVGACGISG